MKKSNLGFTLIELLAVIVILAIIAVISTPLIMNAVQVAKDGATRSSALGYVNAVEKQTATQILSGEVLTTGDHPITFFDPSYKGIGPTVGNVTIDKNGVVQTASLCINDKKVDYANNIAIIDPENDCSVIGTVVNTTPTPDVCFDFDETTGTIVSYYFASDYPSDPQYSECGTEVVVPATINEVDVLIIEEYAFDRYEIPNGKLTSLILPEGLITIGDSAFEENSITSLIVPSTVTSIGGWSFSNNQLASLTLNDVLVNIGGRAFEDNFIPSITLPATLTFVGEASFNNNLLPDNQAYIYARNTDGSVDNTKVVSYGGVNKSITIPNTVINIQWYSLAYNNLTSVTIPSSVTTIEPWAFQHNLLTNLTIPVTVTDIMGAAFNNNLLPSNQAYIYKRNSNGSTNNTVLVSYGGTSTNITIPSTVISTESLCFWGVPLTSVTFPGTFKTVGNQSFAFTGLTSLTIPSTITNIDDEAFMMNNITSITMGGAFTSLGINILGAPSDYFGSKYNALKAGTYIGTQNGPWVKQ